MALQDKVGSVPWGGFTARPASQPLHTAEKLYPGSAGGWLAELCGQALKVLQLA